jgi:hypothetical protein
MKKITVIIPVYNGGKWFQECLESFLPHLECFDTIIASINKSPLQETDVTTFKEFQKKLPEHINSFYLKQKFSLSATAHGFFILWQLRQRKLKDVQMIMAHDDILLKNFSLVYHKIQHKINKNTIINPARSFFNTSFSEENKIYDYYGIKNFSDGFAVDNFILQDFDRHYITNISGVICTREALAKASSITRYLWYGYRAEYIVLTAPGVNTLCSTPEPIIGIRVHATQQGGIEKPRARRWDEFVYLVHLYHRTTDPVLRQKIRTRSRLFRIWFEPHKCALLLLKKIYRKLVK